MCLYPFEFLLFAMDVRAGQKSEEEASHCLFTPQHMQSVHALNAVWLIGEISGAAQRYPCSILSSADGSCAGMMKSLPGDLDT